MITIRSQHIPPSTNAAYRNCTSRDSKTATGRIRTKSYMTWFNAFGYDVNLAMRGQKPIVGPYTIRITLCRSTRHRLSDIMNREKAVSDALQALGVIANDNLCESGTVRWGEAMGGILIEIEDADEAFKKAADKMVKDHLEAEQRARSMRGTLFRSRSVLPSGD